MAVVGAMTWRVAVDCGRGAAVVPGYQSFAREVLDPSTTPDLTQVVARTTGEAEQLMGVVHAPHANNEE
jgi:hypothetical protein